MIEAFHTYVMTELSRAQVRCAREAKRIGADQPTTQSVMFAVLCDMLVANTIAASDTSTVPDTQLEESVIRRYRAVLAQARKQRAKLAAPSKRVIVPDNLPPEIK